MLAPPEGEGKESLPVNEAFTLRGHDGPVLGVRFNKAGTYCLSCGEVSHMPATPSSGMDQLVLDSFSCPSSDERMPAGPCHQAMESPQRELDQDVQW